MRHIIRIAVRNITLNKKRTVITVLTIAVGLGAINTGKGIIAGMQRESRLNVTEGRTGEIQIHKDGYFDASELTLLDYSIDDYSGLRNEVRGVAGVQHVAGRIQFGGLIARGDETAVALFRAVEAADEVNVCPRTAANITDGRFLTEDDSAGAVVAGGLGRGLGIQLGDTVIIVANTRDGFQNAVELKVEGIIEERMAQANRRLVYLPMSVAQELLYMDDAVTEMVIKSSDGRDIDILNDRINHLLGQRPLESNTWRDVAGFFVDITRKQNVVILALCVIFYFIMISSITNTMTLTVFERKREIGTMMAIGIKARDITGLIVTESMVIGLVGSLLGVILSAAAILVLGTAGITRTVPASIAPITVYPFVSAGFMIVSLVLGVLSAVVASIYPARRALAVHPVEALRST